MAALHSDTVAVRKLQLRCGTEMGKAELMRRVRNDLMDADWPRASNEWVFVRRVAARAPIAQLAEAVTRAAAEQMQLTASDDVVRFADLPELLAALLADLVHGTAASRWYWWRWASHFQRLAPTAISAILFEHIEQLPAVVARLSQRQMLSDVWLHWDDSGARAILQQLTMRSRITLPHFSDVAEVLSQWRKLPEHSSMEPAYTARAHAAVNSPQPDVVISAAIRLQWVPVLRSLTRGDNRFQLALLLIGQQVAPLMLMQAPAQLFARLTQLLQPASPPLSRLVRVHASDSAVPAAEAGLSGSIAESDGQLGVDDNKMDAAATQRELEQPPSGFGSISEVETSRTGSPRIAGESANRDRLPPLGTDLPDGAPALSLSADESDSAIENRPRSLLIESDFTEFSTRQGGLLYLLNFLNRPELQMHMRDQWDTLPNGWAWLYRVGQLLAFDDADPLAVLIVQRLQLERLADLENLPRLPLREDIEALAQSWYGAMDVWTPELLSLDARIRVTPSHIDLHAPLASVRLPVRLAALDIDPGWLPWLGQVVTFHYE